MALPGDVNTGYEDDPSWTADRLTIVFARVGNGGENLFKGTRPAATAPFKVQPIDELNSFALGRKSSPEISADGTKIYFAADHNADGNRNVYMSRLSGAGWEPPGVVNVLSDPMADESDIAVSPDGDTAMIARDKVLMLALPAPDGTFGPPTQTSLTVLGSSDVAAPSITDHADTVYFHAGPTRDLYYAMRMGDGFTPPKAITELNTSGRDSAPFVSADGCYLLFARENTIYQASRRPVPVQDL